MTTILTFPQEIIDKIIETLADSPQSNSILAACCVVSSSFSDRAQRQLYNSVSISWHESDSIRNKALNRTFSSCPRVCAYVQSLFITIPGKAFDMSFDSLPNLTELRSMKLEAKGAPLDTVQWTSLPAKYDDDIHKLLWLPTLRRLTISFIKNFPINAFRPCFHLDTLVLWAATLLHEDPALDNNSLSLSANAENRHYLQTLSLYKSIPWQPLLSAFLDPTSSLHIARLRKLTIEVMNDETLAVCQAILDLAGSYIEQLDLSIVRAKDLIYFEPSAGGSLGVLNLQGLPNLRHLEFHLRGDEAPPYMPRILKTIPNIDVLEEITVTVFEAIFNRGRSKAIDNAWRDVDELLAAREHRPIKLRFMKVEIFGYDSRPFPSIIIRRFFGETMPQSLSMGLLSVKRENGTDASIETIIPLDGLEH